MATDEVAGVAVYDPGDGTWDYARATWGFVDGGSGGSAARCADSNGADTTNATNDFHSLQLLAILFGVSDTPDVGDLVMLFRETTFTIEPSDLEPSMLALFRQPYGEDPVEFASGMDTTARFRYRVGGGTSYQDTVEASGLDQIDAVRLQLDARRTSETAVDEDVTFGWGTNVFLRNAP